MKISIITVCYNSAGTLGDTLDSVAIQNYLDIEHIIIDGGSTDGTRAMLESGRGCVTHWQSEPDRGIYDAMNKGLALASGEVIGFLNADDVYTHPDVLSRIAEVMQDDTMDACYANLYYVDRWKTDNVRRVWRSRDFEAGLCKRGWMPAHPTFYVRKTVYQRLGSFNTDYRLQADFDLCMRFLEIHRINAKFIDEFWVRMRMGGASNNSVRNVIKGNWEAYAACRRSGLKVPPWFILTKVLSRLGQFADRSSHKTVS